MMVIPYGRHDVDSADIDAVVSVLQSDYLTQGPVVRRFEEAIAARVGSRRAVAANSATSALHLACASLGVGPGDVVWTSAITFVASANCARYCGADVDFVDIDPDTWNISIDALRAKLEGARRAGRLPKVVIPVHLAGNPCSMSQIASLASEFGFRVVEDASHALGSSTGSEATGACRFSDVTVFSFHPVKMLTTAEGGIATTNDEDLFNRMVRLRSHGITRAPSEMEFSPEGEWYYEQLELGFNYRMPDLFAALGLSQLGRLERFLARRRELDNRYRTLLADQPISFQTIRLGDQSSRHLQIIRPDYSVLGTTQREMFERLRTRGILANLHYIPVYRQPYYRRLLGEVECPEAERYYRSAITLPLYSGLTDREVEHVVNALVAPLGHQTIF